MRTVEGGGTDNRFRARIDREEVDQRLADEVRNTRYANFKSTVHEQARHDAYYGVWDEMNRFQKE